MGDGRSAILQVGFIGSQMGITCRIVRKSRIAVRIRRDILLGPRRISYHLSRTLMSQTGWSFARSLLFRREYPSQTLRHTSLYSAHLLNPSDCSAFSSYLLPSTNIPTIPLSLRF